MIADNEHRIRTEASGICREGGHRQAARGRKWRPQWAGDQRSMMDGGLTARDTCHHVIGSV
jgi:hypothetical protein